MNACAVTDCEQRVVARGWCRRHYSRWHTHGDPLKVLPRGGARKMPPRPRIVRPECRFDGCERLSAKSCKGWCPKHHTRWYRHGDPAVVKTPSRRLKDVAETLRARSLVVDDCWLWQGAKLPNGYGVFGLKGHSRYVHRAAWENVHGPVPPGREFHHTCQNRACCNPEHLVPLTTREHRAAHKLLAGAAA